MGFTNSPLRFPGGKYRLSSFIETILRDNGLAGGHYVEPYAGGAGVAWRLLIDNYVSDVYVNDIDPAIFSFWHSVFTATDELCDLIRSTPVTMANWRRQKAVLDHVDSYNELEIGFATFFLNRTNRSGILRGGVIGGQQQAGEYRLNARYNKRALIKRIERLASFGGHVHLYNRDAADFISEVWPTVGAQSLTYFDPPYFEKGAGLYENHYGIDDHRAIARLITGNTTRKWVVSYDNQDVIRALYQPFRQITYELSYSVQERRAGNELIIFCQNLLIPVCTSPLTINRPKVRIAGAQLPLPTV